MGVACLKSRCRVCKECPYTFGAKAHVAHAMACWLSCHAVKTAEEDETRGCESGDGAMDARLLFLALHVRVQGLEIRVSYRFTRARGCSRSARVLTERADVNEWEKRRNSDPTTYFHCLQNCCPEKLNTGTLVP